MICMQVQLSLGGDADNHAVIACFLIREGADINVKNKNDVTPLDMFPYGLKSIVTSYMAECTTE